MTRAPRSPLLPTFHQLLGAQPDPPAPGLSNVDYAPLAEQMGRFDTVGIDCVAMNVNDVICAGAQPVGFIDYVALRQPNEWLLQEIAKGLVEGARQSQMAIVGGETAVLPDVIAGDENDLGSRHALELGELERACGRRPPGQRQQIGEPLGASAPDSRLMNVVLPAPLGPISAWRAPCGSEKLTSLTAARAPKLRAGVIA